MNIPLDTTLRTRKYGRVDTTTNRTRTATCNRCGAPIEWRQRRDGSWYPAVGTPDGDGVLPASYWRKVGRRPHSCARTLAWRAADIADAERRIAELEASLADAADIADTAAGRHLADVFRGAIERERARLAALTTTTGGTNQ